MIAKLTKWEKQELLRMCRHERKDGRCLIMQELMQEADELTKGVKVEIDGLEARLAEQRLVMEDLLKLHKLNDFAATSEYTCRITTLHPKLVEHDKETNRLVREIIDA